MNRKLGAGVLILCFGLFSVDAARATQVIEVSPIIVQPNDLGDINQQMLEQDRINRDQELAIKGLIDDNQKLTASVLAQKQDARLEAVNQTMINYRDALLTRDRARITANGQRVSKYYDLITLTENVDDMKGVGETLQLKKDVIEEKYKILTDLKDEMTALNEKLKVEEFNKNFQKIDQLQENKIQLLTERLGEMDQRIARYDGILAQKDQQIAQLNDSVGLLKSELENKITTIKGQEDQIVVLKAQAQELSSKQGFIKSQTDQLAGMSEQFKDQHALYTDLQAEVTGLRNRARRQEADLKVKDDSIRWLNEVLAAAKNKSEYYQLTSQQDQLTMQQVQEEMQNIKADFARRLKDDDQFEKAIASFKDQVSRLGMQLSQKSAQVDLLTSQLKDKDVQIVKMKSDLQAILQDEANKEIYRRNALAQVDDRVKLAKQLIDLQQQEASLLDERNGLAAAQNAVFERHSMDLENKIKREMANHHLQSIDLQNRIQELQIALYQKDQQVELLNTTLKDKIAQEKNQNVLLMQIQDLTGQLQEKEDQINTMKADIRSGQRSKEEEDSLRQQLAVLQDKADQLKQQLDSKTADSDKMASVVDGYQKKLESKNNAYNAQLGQILTYRNYQVQMEKQIADLNIQLQQKEAQVITIKKDMYDLQQLAALKERDAQSRDLSLAMVQQKMTDQTINGYQDRINALQQTSAAQVQVIRGLKSELALARQELKGMPSSDEIDFLRTGLKKAVMQVKQKDEMLIQIKANADEYENEFKQQSQEFQSLKDQLQDAYEQINRKNEDLKYKGLELIRFKERAAIKEGSLQDQIRALTRKGGVVQEVRLGKTQEYQYTPLSKNDPLEVKLKQALDKIDQQGRLINILVQKLQAAGQSVDLTR